MSGSRVVRLAALASLLLIGVDLLVTHRLSLIFATGFVLVCAGCALAVRPRDFFTVGVLPPLLLLGCCLALAFAHPAAVAHASDGVVQATISGLAHKATALIIGYGVALGLLAIRQQVLKRGHVKREVSPAPTLVTSGTPEEKSTTVVGDEPHSPESITASNH